jgi:hypothetical protein
MILSAVKCPVKMSVQGKEAADIGREGVETVDGV